MSDGHDRPMPPAGRAPNAVEAHGVYFQRCKGCGSLHVYMLDRAGRAFAGYEIGNDQVLDALVSAGIGATTIAYDADIAEFVGAGDTIGDTAGSA